MYNVGINNSYYDDYVSRDVREFRLNCKVRNIQSNTTTIVSESHISNLKIDYDLVSGAEDYIVGNISSAKLRVTFDNSITIAEEDEIILSVDLKIVTIEGLTVWSNVPIGSFFVFEITNTRLAKNIEAYDRLYQSKLANKYESSLTYPTTTNLVLQELCEQIDITYLENSMPNLVINRPAIVTEQVYKGNGKYETVESSSNQVGLGFTIGEMLSYMASYLSGNFVLDGVNKLRLINLYTSGVSKTYSTKEYSTPIIGDASYNIKRVECVISTGESLASGVGKSHETMVIENPFFDYSRVVVLASIINNINYSPVQVRIKGDPRMQLGDLVKLESGQNSNDIIFPILKMTFSYSGSCGLEVESVCKSKSEKTISYKGSLSSKVDSLESSMESATSGIETLYGSINMLNSFKNNIDGIDNLLDAIPEGPLTEERVTQYNLLLSEIKRTDSDFETEYNLVYNHNYLL